MKDTYKIRGNKSNGMLSLACVLIKGQAEYLARYYVIGQAGYLAGYYVYDKLNIWLYTMYRTGWIFGWILCMYL